MHLCMKSSLISLSESKDVQHKNQSVNSLIAVLQQKLKNFDTILVDGNCQISRCNKTEKFHPSCVDCLCISQIQFINNYPKINLKPYILYLQNDMGSILLQNEICFLPELSSCSVSSCLHPRSSRTNRSGPIVKKKPAAHFSL